MVKVAAEHRHPGFRIVSGANTYPFTRSWRIHDSEGRTEYRVVDARWGLTIVDYGGAMRTSWHIGISPGDLARLEADRLGIG